MSSSDQQDPRPARPDDDGPADRAGDDRAPGGRPDADTAETTAIGPAPTAPQRGAERDTRAMPTAGDDAETTATRRQGFLGLGDREPAARERTEPWEPRTGSTTTVPASRHTDDDALLAGATQARPRSRAAAHGWSLLLTLALAPVAWYLVADAGARLTLGEDNQWQAGSITNPAAVVELVAGLLVVAAVLLVARWSSLGATVVGTVVLLLGLAAVVLPGEARDVVDSVAGTLAALGSMGDNAAFHLRSDAPAGRLALYGLSLLMVGVVSHGARRQGRREERLRGPAGRSRPAPR